MRLIKMLGLAAMAMMVAMAFIGASSASANEKTLVLCKVAQLECEPKNQWASPTEIHLKTLPENPPKLLSSVGEILCEHSTALVTLLNELSELQLAHLLDIKFLGKCHLGTTECEVTTVETGGLSLTPLGELLASLTAVPLEGKETKVKVKCGFFVNCTFSASEKTLLTIHSDPEGHLLALAVKTPLKGSGFLCPEVGEWDAEYHAVDLETDKLVLGLYIES